MTTAIIGTGGIGSVIARELASGGETLRLSSADNESARKLAAEIGRAAVVAADNRDALRGADAVVLALRFTVLKGVIDEIAEPLTDKARGRSEQPGRHRRTRQRLTSPAERAILGRGCSRVVAGGGALGHGVRNHVGRSLRVLQQPVTGAGGPLLRDRRRPCRRGSRAVDPNGRLRAGEGRRDRTVGSARGGRRPSRSRSRPRRGAVIDRWGLTIAIGVVTLAGLSDLRGGHHMRWTQGSNPRAREQWRCLPRSGEPERHEGLRRRRDRGLKFARPDHAQLRHRNSGTGAVSRPRLLLARDSRLTTRSGTRPG